MVVKKRSKKSRMRGSHTHGWGAKKKHRGKGNKGGAGMAGTGKRADSKKPSIWKKRYFGKFGFKKKGAVKKTLPINLKKIQQIIGDLLEKGIAKESKGFIEIDITSIGFNKVLGYGKLTSKLRLIAPSFSSEAKKKIEAVGGQAITKTE